VSLTKCGLFHRLSFVVISRDAISAAFIVIPAGGFYCGNAPDVARPFIFNPPPHRIFHRQFDLFEPPPEGNDSSAILRPETLAGVVALQTPFSPFNQSQKCSISLFVFWNEFIWKL